MTDLQLLNVNLTTGDGLLALLKTIVGDTLFTPRIRRGIVKHTPFKWKSKPNGHIFIDENLNIMD